MRTLTLSMFLFKKWTKLPGYEVMMTLETRYGNNLEGLLEQFNSQSFNSVAQIMTELS